LTDPGAALDLRTFNADAPQSFASLNKIGELLKSEGATLWVNHDLAEQCATACATVDILTGPVLRTVGSRQQGRYPFLILGQIIKMECQ
jgi:hypothetical protein